MKSLKQKLVEMADERLRQGDIYQLEELVSMMCKAVDLAYVNAINEAGTHFANLKQPGPHLDGYEEAIDDICCAITVLREEVK